MVSLLTGAATEALVAVVDVVLLLLLSLLVCCTLGRFVVDVVVVGFILDNYYTATGKNEKATALAGHSLGCEDHCKLFCIFILML